MGHNKLIFSPFSAGITAQKNDIFNESCCHIQQIHNNLYYPGLLTNKNNKMHKISSECLTYYFN